MEQQDPTEFVPSAAHWSLDSAQTIDIDDVRELKVAIVGGRLDVITHDEPVTRVDTPATRRPTSRKCTTTSWLSITTCAASTTASPFPPACRVKT